MEKQRTKTVAFISTKGGTGKTTIAANLAGVLAALDKKVLLIDADPGQPSLSNYFALKTTAPKYLTHLLLEQLPASDTISHTEQKNIDVIASDGDIGLDHQILQNGTGRFLLAEAIEKMNGSYDFILVDTFGAQGATVEMAGFAADIILCPVRPETLAAKELLRGTVNTIESILKLKKMLAKERPRLFCVFNGVEGTRDTREVIGLLRQQFSDKYSLLHFVKTEIPKRATLVAAASYQRAVCDCETPSEAAKPTSATAAMVSLVNEIMPAIKASRLLHQQGRAAA